MPLLPRRRVTKENVGRSRVLLEDQKNRRDRSAGAAWPSDRSGLSWRICGDELRRGSVGWPTAPGKPRFERIAELRNWQSAFLALQVAKGANFRWHRFLYADYRVSRESPPCCRRSRDHSRSLGVDGIHAVAEPWNLGAFGTWFSWDLFEKDDALGKLGDAVAKLAKQTC